MADRSRRRKPRAGEGDDAAQVARGDRDLSMPTAIIVGAIAFLIYVRTLSPGMQMGDGTELATCAHVLGVPHPTGYPLYMLLMKAWLLLTFGGEVIVRTTLLNAILMSTAAGLVTRIAYSVLRTAFAEWREKSRLLASAGAGLSTAVLRFHWDNAVVTEVYALQFLLMVGFVRMAQHCEGSNRGKWIVLAALIVGLGMAHHRMTVFLGLPLLFLLWSGTRLLARREKAKTFAMTGIALFAPLVLYAYLPLRANSAMHWGDMRSLNGIVAHVRGTEYLTRSFLRPAQGRSFTVDTYLTFAARESAQIAGDFASQFAPMPENYYYDRNVERLFSQPDWRAVVVLCILAPFAVVGGIMWMRSGRRTFFISAVIAAQNLLVLFIYNILDIRDYYLFPMWFAWMCVWIGLLRAVSWISERRGIASTAGSYACLLAPLIIGMGNFHRCDQSGNDTAEQLSRAILPNLPTERQASDADVLPGSILLTGGDFDSFTSWYRQLVRGERNDVLVFATNFIWKPWYSDYFTAEQKQRFRLKFASDVARGPDEFANQLITGVIDANITSSPLYTSLQDPAVLEALSRKYSIRRVSEVWMEQDRTTMAGTTITLYRIETGRGSSLR